MNKWILIAAEQVKDAFVNNVAAGGGGRGGRASTVLNKASIHAEMMACVFADYFTKTESNFDPDAFFRACCLREVFIERMAKARLKHFNRQMRTDFREAMRKTKT